MKTAGEVSLTIEVVKKRLRVKFIVVDDLIPGVEIILGTDVLKHFKFELDRGRPSICALASADEPADEGMCIQKKNFRAHFDGKMWIVEWDWREKPELKNKIGAYKVKENISSKFRSEVKRWIENGWLVKTEMQDRGVIPLMAVVQERKQKVRPVFDFRELNETVDCSGADADVCHEKLRAWRQMSANCALVDLRDAYMQIGVDAKCSRYQVVEFEGNQYELTRLGFGLNCAPEVMKAIVSTVLSSNERVAAATDHYYDDIIVNLDLIGVEEVIDHLSKNGLECKSPESIESASVLGLKLHKVQSDLVWGRSNSLEFEIGDKLSKREVFSVCGKLVGHYPVAGWLRVATSFVKRLCHGSSWDDFAGIEAIRRLKEVVERSKEVDPVAGAWSVEPRGSWSLWCDASKIALGVSLENDGRVVEDGAWLRSVDDGSHINLAELNAVVKGVNMAVKWGVKSLKVFTDSATVHSWLSTLLTKDRKIRVSGLSEMLVRRRIELLSETLTAYGVDWSINFVPSSKNKADCLTRVPKEWLKRPVASTAIVSESCPADVVRRVHNMIHRGVETTLHFSREVCPEVTREIVQSVVRQCDTCKSIDPSPAKWNCGVLDTEEDWFRLAIDVTHTNDGKKYLTAIDCGPSRFAIWREISCESGEIISKELSQVFSGFGPPDEILCDNAKSFKCKPMNDLCNRWRVKLVLRCAYRPSGNGIVERHHRTIKTMHARTKKPIQECIYWYNMSPLSNGDAMPANSTFVRK